jgi:hypothetical protein
VNAPQQGKTQYEAFRWIDLHKYLLEEEEERLKQLEALKQSSYLRNNKQSISSDGADHHSRGRIFGIATSLRKCILRTWDCLEWKQRKDCVQVSPLYPVRSASKCLILITSSFSGQAFQDVFRLLQCYNNKF